VGNPSLDRALDHAGRVRLLASAGLAIPAVFLLFPSLQETSLLLPLGLVLLVATALGLPIFATMGGAALLLFWSNFVPIAAVPAATIDITTSPYLPAIPLFTLGGYIMGEGGASKRLMRMFTALVGWMPGGLAIVTTLLLAFFTPLTGASGITILSMGGLLLPVLVRSRYPESSSVGLVTVSGSIGLLLPPSLPVILYAVKAQQPIDRLFVGALLPGILLIMMVAGWGAVRGWFAGAGRTPFHGGEAVAALWESKWELMLPVVILAPYFGVPYIFNGFATLVETAALTVLYVFLVECFIHKDLKVRRDIPRIAVESATMVGGFLIILGMALGLTSYLVDAQIPQQALTLVRANIDSPLVFLLVLNVFLVIVGALMDIYSAIFVVVPLILPMAAAYEIDPIHFGIIFLANMELGYLMPPMGENLFLASFRFKQPLLKIYASTGPYIVILGVAVLLITYVPSMTLWLVEITGR